MTAIPNEVPRPQQAWTTRRLLAKPANPQDARLIFEQYASDRNVAKYMTWVPHQTIRETQDFLERCDRAWANGSAFPWTLWHRDDDAFVGLIEARVGATAVDLGYALATRWWGQGLMSEAVTAVIEWAFAQPPIYRVWATCDTENAASARLLERVGMQREGVLRRWIVHPNLSDKPRDSFCYSIVKAG